ncbi:MAG: gliding motility-associated C-terminal domain-containing protein, partial [Bacteroidota bacterium]
HFSDTEVGFLGEDAVLCNGNPVTISAFSASPGETYLWSTGSTDAEIVVPDEGTFWARVTFANSCEIVDTIRVFTAESFSADLGNDTTLCEGETYTLIPGVQPAGATYLWQDGSDGASFEVTQAGTYFVEITLSGCVESDTIVVDYQTPPNLELGADQEICEGTSFDIDGTTTGVTTYLWEDGSVDPLRTLTQNGTYTLTVSSGACIVEDSIILTVIPLPVFNLGNDTSFCDGENLMLNLAGAGDGFQWQDGSMNSDFTITQSGIYWLDVTLNGCTARDSIEVEVRGIPIVELGADQEFCEGENFTLDATQANMATYLWNDGTTMSMLTATQSGQYQVAVTANNCTVEDSVFLDFKPLPVFELGNDTSFCDGENLMLDLAGTGDTFEWQDGSTNSSFTINQTGIYWLDITLNGCTARDSIEVEVREIPVVELGPDQDICEGETTFLDVTQATMASYLWQDGTTASSFTASQDGLYEVAVTFNNCTVEDSLFVNVRPLPIFSLGNDTSLCDGQSLMLDFTMAGDDFLWQDGSTNSNFTITQTGLSWLEVSLLGCTARDSIDVLVNPQPAVDLLPTYDVCEDLSIDLSIAQTFPANYSWSTGSTDSIITVSQAGQIDFIVESNGCAVVGSTVINIVQKPVFDLGADTIICEQSSFILDLSNVNGQFTWQDGSTNATFEVNTDGTYFVSVLDQCEASDTIIVSTKPLPQLQIIGESTACEGENIMLEVQGDAQSYLWNQTSPGTTLTVSTSQLVEVEGTLDGCTDTRSLDVTFTPVPSVELGPDQNVCDGDVISLDATNANATYSWQDGSSNNIFAATQSGLYSVVVAIGQCTDTDSVNLTFAPSPIVDLGSDMQFCEGEQFTIMPIIMDADQFNWNDGSSGNDLTVAQTGIYWLEAVLGDCSTRDSVAITFQAPQNLNLGPDTTVCQEDTYFISTSAQGSYLWQDGSINSSIQVDAPGTYSLTVDDGVCISTDSVNIGFFPCLEQNFFVPNVFSPNGDGINDQFGVFIDPNYTISSYQLMVFDRWGSLVFQSNNPEQTWNGRLAANEAPAGVYLYTLEIVYQTIVGEDFYSASGDVSLIK